MQRRRSPRLTSLLVEQDDDVHALITGALMTEADETSFDALRCLACTCRTLYVPLQLRLAGRGLSLCQNRLEQTSIICVSIRDAVPGARVAPTIVDESTATKVRSVTNDIDEVTKETMDVTSTVYRLVQEHSKAIHGFSRGFVLPDYVLVSSPDYDCRHLPRRKTPHLITTSQIKQLWRCVHEVGRVLRLCKTGLGNMQTAQRQWAKLKECGAVVLSDAVDTAAQA